MLARRGPVPPRERVATGEQRLITDETPDRKDAQTQALPTMRRRTSATPEDAARTMLGGNEPLPRLPEAPSS